MFVLSGGIAYQLVIGTQSTPIDLGNLRQFRLIEHVNGFLPTCEFAFQDVTSIMQKMPISDGTSIRIKLGMIENGPPLSYIPFRLFSNAKGQQSAESQYYDVKGIYDNVPILRRLVNESYKGTSDTVLSEIAQNFNLVHSGTPTNDDQKWLGNHKTYGQFIDFITNHGWANARSCMMSTVNAGGALIYRDISQVMRETRPRYRFYQNGPIRDFAGVQHPIYDFELSNNSGFLNALHGYGSKSVTTSLSGDTANYETIQADRTQPKFNINREIKSGIEYTRADYSPIDCGNTNPNFLRAKHQNARIKALYSLSVKVMISDLYTDLDLLDPVEVTFIDRATREVDRQISQKYLLIGRVRWGQGTKYYEVLHLVASGFSDDPQQELV